MKDSTALKWFEIAIRRRNDCSEEYKQAIPVPYVESRGLPFIGAKTRAVLVRLGKILPPEAAPFASLSVRTQNTLNNLGIKTIDEAIAAVESGVFSRKKYKFQRPHNFGKKSYHELLSFLGFPLPSDDRPRCKHCGQVLLKRKN